MKQKTKAEIRDALVIAESMLTIIEKGGSFSTAAWFERMLKIRDALATNK
jgi:hypothetical protein